MVWNKKAEAPSGLVFRFGFFYLPLTAAVVIAFVVFPAALMKNSVQPAPFDQVVQARQLNSRLWETDKFTGRTSPFEYKDTLGDIDKTVTRKQMAYSVEMDGKKKVYEEELFDIAKPLAPFRYQGYQETRNIDGKQVTIEIYQPHTYEVKPA